MDFHLIRLDRLITIFHIHYQEATLAKNNDAQAIQNSFEQIQGATINQMQYNPRSSVQHVQQLTGQVQN